MSDQSELLCREDLIEVLDTPFNHYYNDKCTTLGDLLEGILADVIREGEGFSGKRPFGMDSDWQTLLAESLVVAGYVDGEYSMTSKRVAGETQQEIELNEYDRKQVEEFMTMTIASMFAQ